MFKFTDLFFMGAAFLLLETKNVVQFALLFGTTWFVNALVFLGVLLSVLLAVAVSKRITFKHPAADLPATARVARRGLARAARRPADAGRGPPLPRRVDDRVPPDLLRQPHLHAALQVRRRFQHRVRCEPARRHGRRHPRVHGPHHRLPGPADPRGPAVRARALRSPPPHR